MLCAALPFAAPAAEAVDLGTVVVTATRTEREVADVPASVSVITAEEIARSNARSADELLQELAGVDVRHGIGPLSVGTSNKVILRGMGGLTEARALLLIDGVPVNEVYNGGVEWNLIPVEDIRRIEVVRGASSALYGSNAMGGVINILTKRPTAERQVRAVVGYGGMNTRDGSLAVSGTDGRLGYRLSGSVMRSDGYDPLQAKDRKATSIDKGSEQENLRGSVTFDLGDAASLELGGDYYHHQSTGTYAIAGYNPYEQENRSLTGRLGDGRELSLSLYGKSEESGYDSVSQYARTQVSAISASRWPAFCKSHARRKGHPLSRACNAAEGRPAARPQGAPQMCSCGVAVLDQG
ncbi:TonB-dependent receptor plug domain-containing protein [Endothiovibrio diazotrophicus]